MKKNIRTIAALLCAMFCLFTLQTGFAAVVDPASHGSLTLNVAQNGTGISEVAFSAYRVASMNDEAQFEMLDGWVSGGVDIQNISSAEAWSSFAQSMLTQAAAKQADASGRTGTDGRLTLSGLPLGLYLVVGETMHYGEQIYVFAPFMVSVPNKVNDAYNLNVTVDTKFTVTDEVMDLSVMKVWKDEGYTNQRPESIVVDLYCDGGVNQTVTLSSANNWQHTFTNLSRLHTWTIMEKVVPTGYVVSYSTQGTMQIITNTIVVPATTPPAIPPTGLTWWPVPVLGGFGLLLFVLGMVSHRKWRNEHEES